MLMTNEVHAFLFKPAFDKQFFKAWSLSGNTFTFVRDEFMEKTKKAYENIYLHSSEQNKNLSDEALVHFLKSQGVLKPWIIADGNWGAEFVGMILNPNTEKLELWRINALMDKPLHSWDHLFNGSEWSVYPNTNEYLGEEGSSLLLKHRV
jgi:hypothetical protein